MTHRPLRGFEPALLAEARIKGGFRTPADLARRANVGSATIRQWESGLKSPQIDKLALVADALEMPISSFVKVPLSQRFPGDWRVLRGLTQPQLGALVGLTTSAIGQIERAEVALTESSATKIAKALGISIEDIRAAYERARTRGPGVPA